MTHHLVFIYSNKLHRPLYLLFFICISHSLTILTSQKKRTVYTHPFSSLLVSINLCIFIYLLSCKHTTQWNARHPSMPNHAIYGTWTFEVRKKIGGYILTTDADLLTRFIILHKHLPEQQYQRSWTEGRLYITTTMTIDRMQQMNLGYNMSAFRTGQASHWTTTTLITIAIKTNSSSLFKVKVSTMNAKIYMAIMV